MKDTIWKNMRTGMVCLLILMYCAGLPVWGSTGEMMAGSGQKGEESAPEEPNRKPEEAAAPESGAKTEQLPEESVSSELKQLSEESAPSESEQQPEESALLELEQQPEESVLLELEQQPEESSPSEPALPPEMSALPELDPPPKEPASPETATPSSAIQTATVSNALLAVRKNEVLWREAATAEELAEAIQEGVNCRLTADIVLDGPALQWVSQNLVIIDSNGHTIYIDTLVYLFSKLQFFGLPGRDGILNVRKGGILYLSGASVAAGGYLAVKQEEGGIFLETNQDDVTGNRIYAHKPVALRHGLLDVEVSSYPLVVQRGDRPLDMGLYPDREEVLLISQGKINTETVPVFWDFAAYSEALKNRERVDITGNYGESITAFEPPVCTTTFLYPNSAVFLECTRERSGVLRIRFLLDNPASSYAVEWSNDGTVWNSSENAEYFIDSKDERMIEYRCNFTWNPPKYLSAVITTGGQVRYSETVMLTEDQHITASDIGGTRGGSVGLKPPDRDTGSSSNDSGSSSGSSGGSSNDSGGAEDYGKPTQSASAGSAASVENNSGPGAVTPQVEIAAPSSDAQTRNTELQEAAAPNAGNREPQDKQESGGAGASDQGQQDEDDGDAGASDQGTQDGGGPEASGHQAPTTKFPFGRRPIPAILQITAGVAAFGGILSVALWHQKLLMEILRLLSRIKKQP